MQYQIEKTLLHRHLPKMDKNGLPFEANGFAFMKNSALKAFILSLILPGAGQFHNRTYFRGMLWLIVCIALWLSIGAFAMVCHLFSAVAAYNYVARRTGQEQVWPELW
jgi:hypothetical protein